MRSIRFFFCSYIIVFCGTTPNRAFSDESIRFATWNVLAAFSPDAVKSRAAEFERASNKLRPTVLVVQEVTSHEVVAAIRDAMGLKDYYVACSTFSGNEPPPDPTAKNYDPDWQFRRLEVGIISKYPLSQVIEYDPSPDNVATLGDVDELLLQPERKLGLCKPTTNIRGFLWVKLDEPKLTIAIVHFKSAAGKIGEEDLANAQLREFVSSAIAGGVLQDRSYFPEHTCLVAGDFNVGHSDRKKNGIDLRRDAVARLSDRHDSYDETHALLGMGLVGGLRMRNLLAHTMETTYPGFPGSPIDNIYVKGPLETHFSNAEIMDETFGSDHRAVVTELKLPPEQHP